MCQQDQNRDVCSYVLISSVETSELQTHTEETKPATSLGSCVVVRATLAHLSVYTSHMKDLCFLKFCSVYISALQSQLRGSGLKARLRLDAPYVERILFINDPSFGS